MEQNYVTVTLCIDAYGSVLPHFLESDDGDRLLVGFTCSMSSVISDLDQQLVCRELLWERCCCHGGADLSSWQVDDRADVSKLYLEVAQLKA